ncbi:hypothetical protein ACHAW5_008024 [Stephanodiscus triporus]|uniref:RING-type domain-containing protein n=1 Tax=Stephanodiscus triporus TaxID=2934178 RepID=A0ABD3NM37_9STRA
MSAANVDAHDRDDDVDDGSLPRPAAADDVIDSSASATAPSCCPICLDPMSRADVLHPIPCPTPGCDYNFCLNCMMGLVASSNDDYCTASDGSRRVKVRLACPSCRCYVAPRRYSGG